MEEGEQYSEYSVERNHGAYMSMRDYKHLPWKNQQPVERNPNLSRLMRDYRNPLWISASFCSVPPTNAPYDSTYNPSWGNHTNSSWEPRPPQYAPPASPSYASTPQPPQPPQLISLVEQAILNLTKLVGDVVEEQKKFNAQLSQRIHTVENSLNKKVDGLQSEIGQKFDNLQSEIDHKFDNLQCSISKLASQQHAHQEKENQEGEFLSDTMVEEQCLQQL